MKNRTTNMTTGPIKKNNRTTSGTTPPIAPIDMNKMINAASIGALDGGLSVTSNSRPTISGGRVIKINQMNRDNNTMTSNKIKLDRSGNEIYNQVTDYNKIPFKNKAIDVINRVDYNISNAMNRGVENLKDYANNAKEMLKKENYGRKNFGEITSEYATDPVYAKSRFRPTISGGIKEVTTYKIPKKGKEIHKKILYGNEDLKSLEIKKQKPIHEK